METSSLQQQQKVNSDIINEIVKLKLSNECRERYRRTFI